MKFKYHILSVALAALLPTTFASCSDDNEDDAPVPVVDTEELTFSTDLQKVKIGAENKVLLPIEKGAGNYQAFSLNPEIADVTVGDDGNYYIEGFQNGFAYVVVSDAANAYKRLAVSVYTTDQLQLSHDAYSFVTVLGKSATSKECAVVLGNGGYSIDSDNAKVKATIDRETGEITLTATSGKDEYAAVVTVSDISGLSATINVSVKATLDPYTQSEIDQLMASEKNLIDYNGTHSSYFEYYQPQTMVNRTENGITTTGWERVSPYYTYKHVLTYPEGTAVGVEVDGSLIKQQYSTETYTGKVKILADDDKHFVGIFYKVDLEAESIDRGYVVMIK